MTMPRRTPTKFVYVEFEVFRTLFDPQKVGRAMANSAAQGEFARRKTAWQRQLARLCVDIPIRALIIHYALQRLTTVSERVISLAQGRRHDEVIKVDDQTKYALLQDVDSFFFEAKAYCELLWRYFHDVLGLLGSRYSGEGPRRCFEQLIQTTTKDAGFDWYGFLHLTRRRLIHGAAPYVLVDMSDPDRRQHDLIVTKNWIHDFKTARYLHEYFYLQDLHSVTRGINRFAEIAESFLIKEFRECSRR